MTRLLVIIISGTGPKNVFGQEIFSLSSSSDGSLLFCLVLFLGKGNGNDHKNGARVRGLRFPGRLSGFVLGLEVLCFCSLCLDIFRLQNDHIFCECERR